MNEHTEILEQIMRGLMSFLPAGFLAWIGGTAKYLHDVQSGKSKHSWLAYLRISVMTCLTGHIVGLFIPETMQIRDGLIALSGVCAFQLLTALEETGTGIIKQFIERGKK